MSKTSRFQLTLAIIKAHVVKNPIAIQKIRDIIISSTFKVVRFQRKPILPLEAEEFYSEHKGNFFYNRLLTFMTSGPSDIMVLAKENAVRDWRVLMGPTKVFIAQFEAPDTIRGMYGLSDTRNATHGSDSEVSARKEIQIFFPELNIDEWCKQYEPLFRSNKLSFYENKFLHVPVR